MPTQPVMFGNDQESGNAQLAGASPIALNVLTDGRGTVRRRPGLASYSEAPTTAVDATGIAGLYVSAANSLFAVGVNRHLYRVGSGAAVDTSGSEAGRQIAGTARPTFAENEAALIIAGGQDIQQFVFSTLANSRLGATATEAPPKATHVAANSSRFLSNDIGAGVVGGQIRFSRTGLVDYINWPARFFVTAEARPDRIVALGENTNEVWAWGADTTQTFIPDPTAAYAPARTIRYGLASPCSVVLADEQFAWFDPAHRFLLSDARSTKEISSPIAGTLDKAAAFTDCFGYRIQQDQFDCLVWTSVADGRTFCYQLGGGWSQWTGFGPAPFPVSAAFARGADNTNVVGLRTGRICQLSSSAADDLGDPIVADVTTGNLSRGTDARKWARALRLTMQRGATAEGDDEPQVLLSWRDDGGEYCDPLAIGLGTDADKEFTVELRSLGVYRRRQWRLVYSGAAEWVLAGAEEEFDVLTS